MATFLLIKQGYMVRWLYFDIDRISLPDDIKSYLNLLSLEQAQALSEHYNIKLYATDLNAQFYEHVMDPFQNSRLQGHHFSLAHTWNKLKIESGFEKMNQLKFHFLGVASKAKVRIDYGSKMTYFVLTSDLSQDESHLFSMIKSPYIHQLILPLGDLSLKDLERLSQKMDLDLSFSHAQEDSKLKKYQHSNQKDLSFADLKLDQVIAPSLLKTGGVESIHDEKVLGEHDGIHHHYLGQSVHKMEKVQSADAEQVIVELDYDHAIIRVGKLNEYIRVHDLIFLEDFMFLIPIPHHIPLKLWARVHNKLFQVKVQIKNLGFASMSFVNTEEDFLIQPGTMITFYHSQGAGAKMVASSSVLGRRSSRDWRLDLDIELDSESSHQRAEDLDKDLFSRF